MSGNAIDAPTPGSPVEVTETSPSQQGTSNISRQTAAEGVDDTQYPTQEVGPGDTYDHLEGIIHSLPNGSKGQDDIRKNIKKYRRFLLHVAKNEAGKWQEIGNNLGIDNNVKQRLSSNNVLEGREEQAYQMLVYWINSDEEIPTLKKLLRALIKAELVEVAKAVSDVLREDRIESRDEKPVTKELLSKITNDIKDVWKFLGRYLDTDESNIHSITMQNPHNCWEQAHQMLMKWKQSNASRATSQVLIKALKDVGKRNVASFVQEWEKAKRPEDEKTVWDLL